MRASQDTHVRSHLHLLISSFLTYHWSCPLLDVSLMFTYTHPLRIPNFLSFQITRILLECLNFHQLTLSFLKLQSEIRAGMAPFPACDKEIVDLTKETTPPPSDDESSALTEEQKEHIVTMMSKVGRSDLSKVNNAITHNSLLSMVCLVAICCKLYYYAIAYICVVFLTNRLPPPFQWINSSKFQTFRPPRMGYTGFSDKERWVLDVFALFKIF